MLRGLLYIGGEWIEGSSRFTSISPGSGLAFAEVSKASPADVDRAVAVAQDALQNWRTLPVTQRAQVVANAADLLVREYGEEGEATRLKCLIGSEMGKPLPEADIEVIESSDMLRFFAGAAESALAPTDIALNPGLWPDKRSTVYREPVGVVAVIKPWNYPLELPLWTIGPALAAGNTVVFKPSELSPMTGLEVARLFHEAGLPPGVLNVLTGDGDVGRTLVAHDGVDMVSFTGSVTAGRDVALECARRLRRCTLELGGNDAAYVAADADLELAANGIVWGAFCNAGQVCVGIKRAYIHRAILPALIPMLLQRTEALRSPRDVGPLVSERQLNEVEAFIADAVDRGAKVLAGGRRRSGPGFYLEPTILTELAPDSRLLIEECFGPVLPIIPVDSDQAVIRYANAGRYGLGASVWTADRNSGEAMARDIRAGMVWINDVNVAYAEAPWGGRRQSGLGFELSAWAYSEYTDLKHINTDTSADRSRKWWYPYPDRRC